MTKPVLRRAIISLAAVALLVSPTFARSHTWQWSDISSALPHRDNHSIQFVSERQGAYLASDGTHVYEWNKNHLKDLSALAEQAGVGRVDQIVSDGRVWLIVGRSSLHPEGRVFLTDGLTLNPVSSFIGLSYDDIRIAGHDGAWYVQLFHKTQNELPAHWDMQFMNGTNSGLLPVNAPMDWQNQSNPINLAFSNGAWYAIGTTANNLGGVWRMDQTTVTQLSTSNVFKRVLNVWPGSAGLLVATNNDLSTTADRLSVFDGTHWTDLTAQAHAYGLLPHDANDLRAIWTGRYWMLLANKKIVRVDGDKIIDEGRTRDLFTAGASDEQGHTVLGGAVSDDQHEFATEPLTAKLVTVTDTPDTAPLIPDDLSQLVAFLKGPTIATSVSPTDARIGNGMVFTYRVMATDTTGVKQIDIYANGARVKTCSKNPCVYTQVYWTDGADQRTVALSALAINRENISNVGGQTTLIVDSQSNATAQLPMPTTTPGDIVWNTDSATHIQSATWLSPDQTSFTNADRLVYSVLADHPQGIDHIDVWVNGTVVETCDAHGAQHVEDCRIQLDGKNYPAGTDVFVNAQIFTAKGASAWTAGRTIVRAADVVNPETNNASGGTPAAPATAASTFFATSVMTPDSHDVARGTVVTFQTTGAHRVLGLDRIEIFVNGKVARQCRYGGIVGPVMCDMQIDTAQYLPGTNVSVGARAIDLYGNETWSNGKTFVIHAPSDMPTPNSAPAAFNVWSWMNPSGSEIVGAQSATYHVGGWSGNGIAKIQIIAAGQVRQTCDFGSGNGTRECLYSFSPYDYADGETVTVNARLTDGQGQIVWSDANSVAVRRSWDSVANGDYVNVTTNKPSGYKNGDTLTYTARGWSQVGVNRIEITQNGTPVYVCPNDICTWVSAPQINPTVEYQAHLIDNLGRSTWTGLNGLTQK